MALQMSYTSPDGTVYSKCYIPISAIILAPSGGTICTNFFADETVYCKGGLPLSQPAFQVDLSLWDQSGKPFDIGYDYLLTLPEFAGAVLVP